MPTSATAGFSLTLLTAPVPTETILQSSIDKAVKRSYINLQGAPAIVKGAEEFSAHHYVFPDAKLLKTLVSAAQPVQRARSTRLCRLTHVVPAPAGGVCR